MFGFSFNDIVEDDSKLLDTKDLNGDFRIDIFSSRIVKKDTNGNLVVQYILTTPGRILLNKVLQDSLIFSN